MSHNPPLPFLSSILPAMLLPLAMAATSAPTSLPQVDFAKMGTVGLGGSFSGLDWWSDSSAFASSSNSSATFSTTGDTVFLRSSDGSYHPLGSTNAGGTISALCWSTAGGSNGTLYVGGTFSSLSGTTTSNIASYSLSSSSFSPLSSGISGPVEALYCDNTNGDVWVGGSFSAPTGTGGNVGLWSTSSSSWTTIPFGGLNGEVHTIDASSNGDSLYFGGHFTTSYASNSSSVTSQNFTSSSLGNITSVPSAPDDTLTTGNSGYLTPVQIPYSANTDPYVQISINASPSTSQKLYSDPHVLVCPGEAIWLAQDDTAATVDIQGVNYMKANGIRVVNGLVQGRGTKTFSFSTLPDKSVITLTYTDPSTGQNKTCSNSCPLSTDSSVAAQDFIFDQPHDLIGYEMQLKEWIGGGAGLSSIQLLSDGAFGSSVANTNKPLCPGNLPSSSSQQSGDWSIQSYTTNDPRIITYYLTSTVAVGSTTKPSVTFYPYVSSSGIYNVYVVIPGCTALNDCGSRTSVDIQVSPVQGGMSWTSTVSEQVQDDTRTLVYTGPVDASTGNFTPTVLLTLSQDPATPSSGSQYTVVADAIELVLVDIGTSGTNTSRTAGMAPNGTITGNATMSGNGSVAFGLFEYVRLSNDTANAASSTLPNTTETALARLGIALDLAYNSSTSASGWSINAIAAIDNTVYVAGEFAVSGNYSNVVSIDISTGQSKSLDMVGLNGAVHAAAIVDGSVYFGGEFTSTASGGTNMQHLAKWDPKAQSWSAIAGGVNGYVTDLVVSPTTATQLVVTGNFSSVSNTDGSTSSTGGYAVFDASSSTWLSSGILFGNLSTVATSTNDDAFLAGRVSGSSSNAVSGFAFLRTGNSGAEIASLSNVNFGTTGSAAAPSTSAKKRSIVKSSYTRGFLSRFTDSLGARDHLLTFEARATPPTITSTPAPAPAVLAGAFWQNSSTEISILGGNFTSTNGSTQIEGVAFYADGQSLKGPNPPVQGLVRALNVKGSVLYVGGVGVNVSGVGTGLLAYNLDSSSWVMGGMSPLNPASDVSLAVNAIQTRGDTNTVVVAGNFATAGSLSCAGVCLWDTDNAQWSTPGPGLSAGEVRSIDFAGDSANVLVAAGSFAMSTGDVAYVATYSFDNSTWTSLGALPGPALAIAVDDKNGTNIFAAGYSSDGTPYLQNWNGQQWSAQDSKLLAGSIIQQLAFVPMSSEHTATGSIEKDRMLMVSGDLYLEDTGNVTSALYDGAQMHPYLVGSTSTGGLGSGSQLFWSINDFSFTVIHHLARGLVVLVAIAIATGLILLLILIFFLIACINRRRDRSEPREMYEKEGSDVSSTHQNVFHNVQAALEQSLVGVGIGAGAAGAGAAARRSAVRESDPSSYAGTASGAGDEDDEEEGRETTMRYDFDGPELQPGEMSMKAGQRIVVLDDVQSDEWWYARDPATGREGVVPATYVW